MYGNDLSSRSRTLNGGRWRLTRFCSRWSASTSLPVTIVSICGDAGDELVDPDAVVAAPGLEVLAHARPQRLRLADVEHVAALVAEEVDARAAPGRFFSWAVTSSDGIVPQGMETVRASWYRMTRSAAAGCHCSSPAVAVLVCGRSPELPRTGRTRCSSAASRTARSTSRPSLYMELAHSANFRVIVLSSVWRRHRTTPDGPELGRLRRRREAARDGGHPADRRRLLLRDGHPAARPGPRRLRPYAASIVRAIPELRYMSIGNEPNNGLSGGRSSAPAAVDAAAEGVLPPARRRPTTC